MFGRQAVLQREHRGARRAGEPAAQAVEGLEIADRSAAAVQVDDQRQRAGCGAVQTGEQRPDAQVADFVQLRAARARPDALGDAAPDHGHVEVGERGARLRDERGELLVGERDRRIILGAGVVCSGVMARSPFWKRCRT